MTWHTGIDGSAPPAPVSSGTFVAGHDLGGEDRRARLPEPSQEGATRGGTNRPNTEYRRAGVVRRRFQAPRPIHPRKSK